MKLDLKIKAAVRVKAELKITIRSHTAGSQAPTGGVEAILAAF